MHVRGDRAGVEALVEFLKEQENGTAQRREVETMLVELGLIGSLRDLDAVICAAEELGLVIYHDQIWPHLIELVRATGAEV